MRVFLIWPDKDSRLVGLMKKLKEPPYELIYWLGHEYGEIFNQPGTIFHSHSDAARGLPPKGVGVSDFLPPDNEIIGKLYKVESMFLTMQIDASDKESVEEKRRIYYRLLRFWLGMFKKYCPEVLIFPILPHRTYDYLAYELAKLFSIKVILFIETKVSDRMLFMNDFREGSIILQQEIEKNTGHDFKLEDLNGDLQKYYEARAIKQFSGQPLYIDYVKNKYSFTYRFFSIPKIKRSIKEGTLFKKIYCFLFKEKSFRIIWRAIVQFSYRFCSNLKKEYKALEALPDFNKNFVFVALQVQPECSTSPMGDMFVDQILMLEILSASLPKDWVIYVKEHPIQWIRKGINYSSSRYRGYYKNIAAIKNVQIVPAEISSYTLIDKSRVVATVTGAPGWEAILRSKPSIVFGHAWYKDCPGVFKANDVESCRLILEKIAEGYKVEQQKVINYLKSLDGATIHGYLAPSNATASKLNRQENMDSIIGLILNELQKMKAEQFIETSPA